ncbi:MAG: hypothetical protein LBJ25_00375 [Candidatus Margulisbacteria bacterium]|jgi:hypothetical protein|nr:hypothetical protein [Candidatus Margulisiibacteriota bacterium]
MQRKIFAQTEQKEWVASETGGIFPFLSAQLEELEAAERRSAGLLNPRNIASRDPVARAFLQDLKKGQSLRLNDLFDLLKKILISPEAKLLFGGYGAPDAENSGKYYFHTEFIGRYREALAASGVRENSAILPFLQKAGLSPEQAEHARLKHLLENILADKKLDLTSWLKAQDTFLLLTLLLKNSARYTIPFDLTDPGEAKSVKFFYLLSVLQDILLGNFTNLAEVSLEHYSQNLPRGQALAVFKISLQDKDLRAYEKLLALLLILGRFSLPWDTLYIYCRDNDRDTLLNGSNFYAAFSYNGSRAGISYAGALKFLENNYLYTQKLIAELDSEKNNPAVSDFQEITPLLRKALVYLNPAQEIAPEYFPETGFVLRLSGRELILPLALERPGRIVFGLHGEYQHALENTAARDGFRRALAGHRESEPDFSIALDYQRLSVEEKEYFQQINQTPFAELNLLALTGYTVRLIELINNPVTKGDFIEKVIELLYLNYNSLTETEKNLFAGRLALAVHNASAADRVKIVCRDVLRRLADTGKISPRNYNIWLDHELSYRGLEQYAGKLLQELKTLQKRRQSHNLSELLTEMLLRFLPLLRDNNKNRALTGRLLNKLWKIKKQFLKNHSLAKTDRLLNGIITTLETLQAEFHDQANSSEQAFYKPLWRRAPPDNALLARARPFLIDAQNVLGLISKNKNDDRNLFIQFMHELDLTRGQRGGDNLVPARQVVADFLGADNMAELQPLILHEMKSEVQKFLGSGGSFEQAWYNAANGSASAYTISSILAYASGNKITLALLAEDLHQMISAEAGAIPGLSKNSIEDKLLRCLNPNSGVSVNAGVEKLLIAAVKLRTNNIYCAYDIGLCCNTPDVVGRAIYNMISKAGAEPALQLIEGTATKFHDHKNVRTIAIGSLLSPRNNVGALSLLEFNEKGRHYDLIGTLDILLWTLGAMACIPQIADGVRPEQIAAYLYFEQGQKWEELKKVRAELKNLLAKPDYAGEEYSEKSRALRERLIALHLGFTFPKGRGGVARKLVRGSADIYDYLMSSQLLAEASQKLKDTLSAYHSAENRFPLALRAPQAQEILNSAACVLNEPLFIENVGLVWPVTRGKQKEYFIYSEYQDVKSRQKHLVQRSLSDSARTLQIGGQKLRETARSIRHFEQAAGIISAK